MQPTDFEKIEQLVNEIADRLPDPRSVSRRSIGVSVGTVVLISGIWFSTVDPREDPWTGAQAADKHREQDAEIYRLRGELEEATRELWTLKVQHAEQYKRFLDIERKVQDHQGESREWITVIKRNTAIILSNQEEAHSHNNGGR